MAYLRPLTGVHPPSSFSSTCSGIPHSRGTIVAGHSSASHNTNPKNNEKENDKYTQFLIQTLTEKCQLLTDRLTLVEGELTRVKQLESTALIQPRGIPIPNYKNSSSNNISEIYDCNNSFNNNNNNNNGSYSSSPRRCTSSIIMRRISLSTISLVNKPISFLVAINLSYN